MGTKGIFTKKEGYDVEDRVKQTSLLSVWAYDTKIYADFIRLINLLSIKFPHVNIVVRPHPSEDMQTYINIFSGIKNVHVIHSGSVVPWLLACKVLIHNGCTTAVEAHFLNTKIITYKPTENTESNFFLPNLLGVVCTTEQAVAAQVESFLGHGSDIVKNDLDPRVNKLISNFDSSEGLGKLLGIIEKAEKRVGDHPLKYQRIKHNINELLFSLYGKAKNIVRPLFPEKERLYRFFMSPQLFSGFSPKDIKARAKIISGILKKNIDVKFHAPELFSLEGRK